MELKLTPSGLDLLKRALAGEADIDFTALQLGNGADGGEDASALSNPLLTAELSGIDKGDIFVTLTATFSNNEVTAGFRCTETGVLAKDPDNDGGTLLYAYGYTKDAAADYIPAGSDRVLETQMDVLVYIGDAENVTASISESLVYASRADLDALKERVENLNLSKDAVGLGNVPNVSTNDQTPTWTIASSLTALVSGEKLSTALGKLAKAVLSLIEHIGALGKNIHKETPKSIGAAAESHTHSTADITSGTLGLARGGTAVTSYSALREKLGLGSGTGVLAVAYGGTGVSTESALYRNKRSARYVVGTSKAGWTAKDCDYLCDGTDDQEEINEALAAVRSGGGTVLLLDGAYSCSGSITFVKAGTELRGTAGAKITFTADDLHILCSALNDCAIRGLYVTGQNSSGSKTTKPMVIYATGCARLSVQSNTVTKGGIALIGCTESLVQGNTVGLSNSYVDGINLTGGSGNTVTGNNFSGGYYAALLSGETKLVFSGNTCTKFNEYGIYATDCDGLTISDNTAHSAVGGSFAYGGYFSGCKNLLLTGNCFGTVEDANDRPLTLSSCQKFVVTGNTIVTDYTDTPLRLSGCTLGIVRLNNIVGKSGIGTGVSEANSTEVAVCDNLASVYNSTTGSVNVADSGPVFGVYTGDGTVKRLISLGFTPSAVLVCNGNGMVGDDVDGVCGGLCVGANGLRTRSCTSQSHETTWSDTHTAMLIGDGGFYVNYDSSNKIATNKSGETYRYIAFR